MKQSWIRIEHIELTVAWVREIRVELTDGMELERKEFGRGDKRAGRHMRDIDAIMGHQE